MPPSARMRGTYLVACRSYHTPTIKAVDKHLTKLSRELVDAAGTQRMHLLHDADALLDRRNELQREA